MIKRGFSTTTYVSIAVLIAFLFGLGKWVIPPPPAAPEPPASKTGSEIKPSSAADKLEMVKHQKELMQMQNKRMSGSKPPPKPVYKGELARKELPLDPDQVVISPGYYKTSKPGIKGTAETLEKVVVAKGIQKARTEEDKLRKAQQAAPKPTATPAPTPTSNPSGASSTLK